jgi:hypothetical protein
VDGGFEDVCEEFAVAEIDPARRSEACDADIATEEKCLECICAAVTFVSHLNVFALGAVEIGSLGARRKLQRWLLRTAVRLQLDRFMVPPGD